MPTPEESTEKQRLLKIIRNYEVVVNGLGGPVQPTTYFGEPGYLGSLIGGAKQTGTIDDYVNKTYGNMDAGQLSRLVDGLRKTPSFTQLPTETQTQIDPEYAAGKIAFTNQQQSLPPDVLAGLQMPTNEGTQPKMPTEFTPEELAMARSFSKVMNPMASLTDEDMSAASEQAFNIQAMIDSEITKPQDERDENKIILLTNQLKTYYASMSDRLKASKVSGGGTDNTVGLANVALGRERLGLEREQFGYQQGQDVLTRQAQEKQFGYQQSQDVLSRAFQQQQEKRVIQQAIAQMQGELLQSRIANTANTLPMGSQYANLNEPGGMMEALSRQLNIPYTPIAASPPTNYAPLEQAIAGIGGR